MRYTTGWVKVRRQDPSTFELLSIEAQAFYFLLTRLLDDRGELSLPGPAGLRGICRELKGVGAADWVRIKGYLDELCDEGSLIWDPAAGVLAAPAHVEDQKRNTTEADRKRVYRAKRAETKAPLPSVPYSGTNHGTNGSSVQENRPVVHSGRPDTKGPLRSVPPSGTFDRQSRTSGLRSLEEEEQENPRGNLSTADGVAARELKNKDLWVEREGEAVTCADAKRLLLAMVKASRDGSGVARLLLLHQDPTGNETLTFQSALSRNPCTLEQVQEMGRLLAQGEYPNRGRGAAVNALCAHSTRGDAFAELLAKAKAPPGLRANSGGTGRASGRVAPSAPADGQTPASADDVRGYLRS